MEWAEKANVWAGISSDPAEDSSPWAEHASHPTEDPSVPLRDQSAPNDHPAPWTDHRHGVMAMPNDRTLLDTVTLRNGVSEDQNSQT